MATNGYGPDTTPSTQSLVKALEAKVVRIQSQMGEMKNNFTHLAMRVDNIEDLVNGIREAVNDQMTQLFQQMEAASEMFEEIMAALEMGEGYGEDSDTEEIVELESDDETRNSHMDRVEEEGLVGNIDIEPLELGDFGDLPLPETTEESEQYEQYE